MDRRRLLLLLASAGCALATGCEGSSSENGYVENLRDHLAGVKRALDTLKSTVDDFDTKDWRDVVPDVHSNIDDLEKEISDLEDAIEPYVPEE